MESRCEKLTSQRRGARAPFGIPRFSLMSIALSCSPVQPKVSVACMFSLRARGDRKRREWLARAATRKDDAKGENCASPRQLAPELDGNCRTPALASASQSRPSAPSQHPPPPRRLKLSAASHNQKWRSTGHLRLRHSTLPLRTVNISRSARGEVFRPIISAH